MYGCYFIATLQSHLGFIIVSSLFRQRWIDVSLLFQRCPLLLYDVLLFKQCGWYIYNLMNYKIYKERFSTECFSDYFKDMALNTKVGLNDYVTYEEAITVLAKIISKKLF